MCLDLLNNDKQAHLRLRTFLRRSMLTIKQFHFILICFKITFEKGTRKNTMERGVEREREKERPMGINDDSL